MTFNLSLTPAQEGYHSVSPTTGFDSSGNSGGPFYPASKTYTLTNTGDLQLNWIATKTSSWIDLSSTGGTLGDGESAQVTIKINSSANSLTAGNYTDTITFTNTTNGNGDTTRPVTLTVNQQNNPPTKPELIEPPDKSTGVPTTVTFIWNKSTDPDGDPVSYELYVCTNSDPGKCAPVQISLREYKIYYAGIASSWGVWIIPLIISILACLNKWVRTGFLILFILAGLYTTSCKKLLNGGSSEYTITGLAPYTTYYWKVLAMDNKGGKTNSDIWSFTTGIE